MSRRFQDLAPQEVLALAIHVERANGRRMATFADVFRGYEPEIAERFDELAEEEAAHERMLTERYRARFGDAVPTVDEDQIAEPIESIDLDDAEHLVFDSLEARQVFRLALDAEQYAHDFYEKAAASAADPELRALYAELAELETSHASWVEQMLAAQEAEENKERQ